MLTRKLQTLPVVHFFRRSSLRLEMLVIIMVKLALIFLLWKAFFSHPTAKLLDHPMLIRHFVG